MVLTAAAAAVLILAMTLTACNRESEGRSPAYPATELFHPLAKHFSETYADDLDGLMKRRHIRVLIVFNKTNFFISGGKIYGFEYTLLKDYEKYLNKSINRRDLKVTLDFVPVARDEIIPALIEGRGDIAAAGLTITPERLKQVDFTRPYIRGIDEVVITNRDEEGVESLEDLAGRRVFVRESSSYYESLLELNRKLMATGLRPVRIVKADETLETEDILEMVNSGAVRMTVADSHLAEIWSEVFDNISVREDLALRKDGQIAWMIRKDNPQLKASLDGFIGERRQGTLIGNIYFNRYFKENRWIRNPFSSRRAMARQKRYEEVFRKYADRYGFDWKLVMALAYQESGLNQLKRSSAGAVGIMQVRPSTAADRRIGIKDIHLLDNNVHAGTKYLAVLRDQYFNEDGLSEEARLRFSLAAYNAGPAKIRRARNLAARMGLDPNRWFRNVEIAALRIVGQETVRYVSNVNKYYVVFGMAFEGHALRGEQEESGNAPLAVL